MLDLWRIIGQGIRPDNPAAYSCSCPQRPVLRAVTEQMISILHRLISIMTVQSPYQLTAMGSDSMFEAHVSNFSAPVCTQLVRTHTDRCCIILVYTTMMRKIH